MAKKSMIARDVKRKKMAERYAAKRAALMAAFNAAEDPICLLYTSPSPRDRNVSRMPSSA